ncbi:hypothetical protein Patl1_31782 [Pistacia atlantica]|uniref:Uncharacterized protein n=1 Tax=Pistacia atlantica TaxID=434234 RepID=A0ACC1APP6_9ROSI|nr:hypothetical protein Patl1_31782 [Pistacia atlantica]
MGFQSLPFPKFPTFFIVLFSLLLSFNTSKAKTCSLHEASLSVEDASDVLSSPNKTFTYGFYGLGQNAYWFSIWFTNSKERTVVWMANRDRPVNRQGSKVIFSRNGAMVLTDVDDSMVKFYGKALIILPIHFFKSTQVISRLGKGNYASGLYSLNNLTGSWMISWQAIMEQCKVHGICGRNGICVSTPEPKCSCPPGYEVTELDNWNKGFSNPVLRHRNPIVSMAGPVCQESIIMMGSPSMYDTTGKRVRWIYMYWFALAIGAIEVIFLLLGWWLIYRRHGVPSFLEDGYHALST